MPAVSLYNRRLNAVLLATGLAFYWVLSLCLYAWSEMPLESGDGVSHYQLSRFSWETPGNFMHHWGKPLFTILSSPFAQAGFAGMVVFNLVLFSLSSWFLYALGRRFDLPLYGLGPVLLMSSCVYFQMVNAGMTEILMATLVMAGVLLFALNKSGWAAVVVSLTVVARPESVVVIPAFGLLLAASGEWKRIPLLGAGFLLFSGIGFLFFDKEPGWVFSESPYAAISPYGSGRLAHFVLRSDLVFGYLLLAMLPVTLAAVSRRAGTGLGTRLVPAALFSLAVVVLVLALHSMLWWQGWLGSLGLLRVMATVTPLAALCALYALHFILERVRARAAVAAGFVALLVFSGTYSFEESGLPVKMDAYAATLKKAADWYRAQRHRGKVSYLAPYFGFSAGLNPEDRAKVILLWELDPDDPAGELGTGDLIVWDSKFGPLEGGISETAITDSPRLRVRRHFESDAVGGGELEERHRVHIAEVVK